MDYTREPIIETVITPRDGCKLVVRNSKGAGQEEYFVDAIEVVSFGSSSFFRSIERPKPFLVPVTDYEVLEVREARMVLKNVGLDRSIKIGGGRESPRSVKDPIVEKVEILKEEVVDEIIEENAAPVSEAKNEKIDRKRERRRHYRRRRGRDDAARDEVLPTEFSSSSDIENQIPLPEPKELENAAGGAEGALATASSIVSSLLPPPPTLISETIERYKKKGLFKEAFFTRDEEPISTSVDEVEAEREEGLPLAESSVNLEDQSLEISSELSESGTLGETLLSQTDIPAEESKLESKQPLVQFNEQDHSEMPPADPLLTDSDVANSEQECDESPETSESSEILDEPKLDNLTKQPSIEEPVQDESTSQIPNNHGT